MNRDDFVKLVGTGSDNSQYLPVAFLLRNSYACAGYYNPSVNEGLLSTCVLLNARLIELQGENKAGGRASIHDFNDFLEEVVVDFCETGRQSGLSARADAYGKSIPLTAIPYDQIAVVYPVAHISALMRRAGQQEQARAASSFLDLNKSEILTLIRTKLW